MWESENVRPLKVALCELLVLGLAGLVLGAAANAIRTTGSLKWNHRYFRTDDVSSAQAVHDPSEEAPDTAKESPFKHPYQEATLDDVFEIAADPDADRGLYVLVDARSADVFSEGHIAGAIRCYHYEIDDCIDSTLEAALGALKVIVYCNGGDCEDSKYMCRELVDRGVPYEAVYLYAGGWKEWIDQEMPFVTGDE